MRLPAIAAAALLSLSACSGSDPAPIPRSGIVLFTNASYVDYTTLVSPGYGHEARNVEEILYYQLETVTTFTGITSSSIDAALAGKAVFVIPELEVGNLNTALDTAARNSIASFVAGGGTLVICNDYLYRSRDLLNGAFGYSIALASFSTPGTLNTTAAVGTPFAGGPTSIPWYSETYSITAASLPAGSVKMYTDASGNAGVALIPYGAGGIVVLGWDFWNAWPLGSYDGGWIDVFYSAVAM